MRLKEDRSSWHSSAIIKRDARHDHNEYFGRAKTKKDTVKWCRGKIGKPHMYKRFLRGFIYKYIEAKCIDCGKLSYSKQHARNSSIPLHIEIKEDSPYYLVLINVKDHPYTEVIGVGCGCEYCHDQHLKTQYYFSNRQPT